MATVSSKSENIASHWLCPNIASVVTNRILALKTHLAGLYLGLNFPFSPAPLPGVPSDPGRACRVSGS